MLRETFQRIAAEYTTAKSQSQKHHPLADFIRKDAAQALAGALGQHARQFICQASPGKGNFAHVPWLAVLDPVVTQSPTRGYYIVYLFNADLSTVTLSLNQGTTTVRREFKSTTRNVLRDRATLIRQRLHDYVDLLPITEIDLGSLKRLPVEYEAGHAMGIEYSLSALPDESILREHLQTAARAYHALSFRGGLDLEDISAAEQDGLPSANASVTEQRQYRLHRKIERNGSAPRLAKKHHGTTCQVCQFSFVKRYGELGVGYIEAHHMIPMSSLEEGKPIELDIAKNFAVLCSNCHRMIHRSVDPSDLEALRRRLIHS